MNARNILFPLILTLLAPLSHAGPPAQSGSNVVRFDFANYWFYIDRDLVVVHGLDVPTSCSTGGFVLEDWYAQFVNIPADEFISVAKVKGDDILTQIYPSDLLVFDPNGNMDFTGTCVNWASNPNLYGFPVAAGTARVIFTANNVSGPGATNPRSSAVHMSAHGLLDTYDSTGAVTGQVLLNGGFQCNWKGDFTPEACNYTIRLN